MKEKREIELKLLIENPVQVQAIRDFIQNTYPEIPKELLNTDATYYDTPDNILQKRKFIYRLRKQNNLFLATIKGRQLKHSDLFCHVEINRHVHSDVPDLTPFQDDPIGQNLIRTINNEPLVPLLRTVFKRENWLVTFRNTKIEISLDIGEIIAGKQKEPICELEFELVSGQNKNIFACAKPLQDKFHLKTGTLSKFARGLSLLDNNITKQ